MNNLPGTAIGDYSFLLLVSELAQLLLALALLYYGFKLRKQGHASGTWLSASAALFVLRAVIDHLDVLVPPGPGTAKQTLKLVDDLVIIAALACLLRAKTVLVSQGRETPPY